MPSKRAFLLRKPAKVRRKTLHNPSGLYPGTRFYVIRVHDNGWGLASLEPLIAANCAYAEARGYVPVVDLKNTSTIYHEAGEVGKVNVWDYYYEQPGGYSLDEAMRSAHVVLGCSDRAYLTFFRHWYFGNPANRKRACEIFTRYIRLNPETKERIEADCRTLLPPDKRTLGVICRGTDFVGARPEEHAIPPTAAEAIGRAKRLMAEKNCLRLFLATEDADVLSAFQNAFPDAQLIVNPALRFSVQPGKLLADYEPPVVRERDRYLRGLEYLTTLTLLSKCQCLLGSACSSFNFAFCRCPNREYVELIDKGTY